MTAATVLYEGKVSDTASIITAMALIAASEMLVIPCANGLDVIIMHQGSA